MGLSVRAICAILCITKDGSDDMVIKIDFNSDEALYMQLRNQIIVGIATSQIQEGNPPLCAPAGGYGGHQHAYRE